MDQMIKKFFPEGQRKLVVSLIALAIALGFEKFGGGLTPNMQDSLIAIVAIFTGGNVMEHLANALKIVKGSKIGDIVEAILPGDQGLGREQQEQEQEPPKDLTPYVQELYNRMASVEQIQGTQAKNIESIVKLMPTRQAPAGPVNHG